MSWQACAQTAKVTFFNSSSGEALSVAISYSYRRFDRNRIADGISDQAEQVASAQSGVSKDLKQKIVNFDATPDRARKPIPEQATRLALGLRNRDSNRSELTDDLANERARIIEVQREVEKWMKVPPSSASEEERKAAVFLNDGLIRLGAFLFDGISALELVSEQPPLSECPDPTSEAQVCAFKFTIFDNGTFQIPPAIWRQFGSFLRWCCALQSELF